MQTSEWKSTAGDFSEKLPKLAFPLKRSMPKVYKPQRTILRMSDDSQTHAYLWCYLERQARGSRYVFKPSSLSSQRVNDLPRAIQRLSKRFRFDNSRPRSITSALNRLSGFLAWTDDPLHMGRYESILSDPDLALEALRRHHSHLRQRMQINHAERRISEASASHLDVAAIKMMSVIHDREYGNEIESIRFIHGEGVKAPTTKDVAAFMACVQGIYDSAVQITLEGGQNDKGDCRLGVLRWQLNGQELSVSIPAYDYIERVMELGCMAFAALCIGDSGANLAQIQSYEEPEDVQVQLGNPEKLNLRQKVIKLRAGGKEVPVHLTSTTVTRMRSYLQIREALRLSLDCPDIGPMFVQCGYDTGGPQRRPRKIIPIEATFTDALRRRFSFVGIELPSVTMQQLRTYKQGKLTKEHNPKIAADMMGTSLSTAIRKYSKITEAESRSEMDPFLASLTKLVRTRSEASADSAKPVIPITAIPPGGCADHGNPRALHKTPLVKPDCSKTEGCFFCDKFRVHADEMDANKLMSCRWVLERLPSRVGDSGAGERVYDAVVSRIGALLREIKRLNAEAHEAARKAVQEEGRLTRYWASKLQQLHLLGLLTPTPTETWRSDGKPNPSLTNTGPRNPTS